MEVLRNLCRETTHQHLRYWQMSFSLLVSAVLIIFALSGISASPWPTGVASSEVTDFSFEAQDDQLTPIVQYVTSTNPPCTGTTGIRPLHIQFPLFSQIVNNETLNSQFSKQLTSATLFSNQVSDWLNLTTLASYNRTRIIEDILRSIVNTEQSFQGVGLCINGEMYYSHGRAQTDQGLCQSPMVATGTLYKAASSDSKLQTGLWGTPICDPSNKNHWILLRKFMPILDARGSSRKFLFFEFDLRTFPLDQCTLRLDRCRSETTKCIYQRNSPPNSVFVTGNYICQCRKGFYRQGPEKSFPGLQVETDFRESIQQRQSGSGNGEQGTATKYDRLNCQTCKKGCGECDSSRPCEVEYELKLLRGLPLAVQSFCITVCLVTGVIVFRIRRTRVIKASNWILLEIFLMGAVLLYATIVCMYFHPTNLTCIVQPWLRELGFSVMYGTLLMKIYRVLSGFQSRKAHRVHVRDKDMLKYLGGFILLSVGYMAAWTAANLDHHFGSRRSPMLDEGRLTGPGEDELRFTVCRAKFWDIVIEVVELIILCLGLYYCHCIRSAPSEYSEIRFITIAMINETVVSAIVHIVRHFVWYSLHPDYVYLIYFIRCHATVTITVILIIGPKFWYLHRPPPSSLGRTRAVPNVDVHLVPSNKLNLASNGDLDIGEINLADMDPEVIRRELKRLYTQIEIYKTKAMRRDNPHVSKRRGGRKQRRFSLQPFHKKHHQSTSVHDEEVSKLSEESTNSADEQQQQQQTATKSV